MAVMMCVRFPLSLHDVEDLLHEQVPATGFDVEIHKISNIKQYFTYK
jgi:hypothetical protein